MGFYKDKDIYLGHTRLSIVNPESGSQPIRYKGWVMVINGEIYNARVRPGETDCHMVIKLLRKYGVNALKRIDGVFSFVAYNIKTKKVIVARDPIGVMPLYWSNNAISSLLTCLRVLVRRVRCHQVMLLNSQLATRQHLGNGRRIMYVQNLSLT